MTNHSLQVIALCVLAYIISVPLAFTCVPLLKLIGLVPLKQGEPSWGTAAVWPLICLIGLFLLPIEIITRAHDKVEEYVKHHEDTHPTPKEPNPVAQSSPEISVDEMCVTCNQPITVNHKQHERLSKLNDSKRTIS